MAFKDLWDAYPKNTDPCTNPVSLEPCFDNQCAIRMGVCLARCNFDMKKFEGVRCWYHPKSDNHTLRVEELKLFLADVLPNDSLTIKRKLPTRDISVSDFTDKSGIIIFINFWGDNNQGDHIDLWTGDELMDGDLEYFERSERVYLWEID